MKIKVSSSFEGLIKRVDCKVILGACYLDKLDIASFDESTILNSIKKDVKISANGIWEEDTKKLKLLVIIPENKIAKENDEFVSEEYGAIYFSSNETSEPAFVIYDTDEQGNQKNLELSLGKNLIDIEFPPEFLGRIELVDTSDDTKFLETFGQNPGKNIFTTENEDALVSKETYYTYWLLETTNDKNSRDLPLLDDSGKLVAENYRYRVYSNLVISCSGLTRNTTPHTRYGLSDKGGTIPILGTCDFIEYSVFGNTIKEELRGTTTIDNIPSSEIVYLGGHNDSGYEVDLEHNIFNINNYSSLIDYIPNANPTSYGADGIFGLRLTYYDVKEGRSFVVNSENTIKLVRRERSDSWFVLRSTTHYIENTEDFGYVPVYLFPWQKEEGTESFVVRTKFLEPINDISQLQVTYENPELQNLFSVSLGLEPFVDTDGTYYVDVLVNLKAKTDNTDPRNWLPMVDEVSTLGYTKLSYGEYFEVFYMVQCPKIEDSLKLVDSEGNRISKIILNYGLNSNKSYYVVADEETDDLGERNSWKVLKAPDGCTFSNSGSGLVSGRTQQSYSQENTLTTYYNENSQTAQDIIPEQDIIIARLKPAGISEDLSTTTNWRIMVDVATIHVAFTKIGRPISLSTNPSSRVNVNGIGLYELRVTSNCRFTISTIDTRYKLMKKGSLSSSSSIESPSYASTNKYLSGHGAFEFWVRVEKANATEAISLEQINVLAQEGDRSSEKNINVNQAIVSSNIYKLKQDGTNYSTGEWKIALGLEKNNTLSGEQYVDTAWIKMKNTVSNYSATTTYKKGDVVKYNIAYSDAVNYSSGSTYNNGDVVRYLTTNDWWRSRVNSNNTRPGLDSTKWECITQYFLSQQNGNRNNLPSEGNLSSNSWWFEIPSVSGFEELDQRATVKEDAGLYQTSIRYKIGDMVRQFSNASSYTTHPWNATSNYTSSSKVYTGSGENTRYWNGIADSTGVEPGVGINWEYYWTEVLYTYYIAGKTEERVGGTVEFNQGKLGSSGWWENISNTNFRALSKEKRYIIPRVSSSPHPYLYMNMIAYVDDPNLYINNPTLLRDEIENYGSDSNEEVLYVLNNPEIYKAGTSIKVVDPNDRFVVSYEDNLLGGFKKDSTIYIYLRRDSEWITMNTLDSLMMTLGDEYNDLYFTTNYSTAVLTSDEIDLQIKYSHLIPSHTSRIVKSGSDYVVNDSIEDLSTIISGAYNSSQLFPYYNSLSELPMISELPKCGTSDDSKFRFIKTYYRIPDGNVIRMASLDWSEFNISAYSSGGYQNAGPIYRGMWSSSYSYFTNDIVFVSSGNIKVFYKANNNVVSGGTSPKTDTTNWSCITWSPLSTVIIDGQTLNVDTDARAIQAVKIEMGLNSDEVINVLNHIGTQTLYNATVNYVGRNPNPGEIIKVGSTYYYAGAFWKISPTVTPTSLTYTTVPGISYLPDITKGYTNIICKVNGDSNYYGCKTVYLFNNVRINQYIFVPKYSNNTTEFKFFSRKSPTETLQLGSTSYDSEILQRFLSLNGSIIISKSGTPEFDESDDAPNDHYVFHSMELDYSEGISMAMEEAVTGSSINALRNGDDEIY